MSVVTTDAGVEQLFRPPTGPPLRAAEPSLAHETRLLERTLLRNVFYVGARLHALRVRMSEEVLAEEDLCLRPEPAPAGLRAQGDPDLQHQLV